MRRRARVIGLFAAFSAGLLLVSSGISQGPQSAGQIAVIALPSETSPTIPVVQPGQPPAETPPPRTFGEPPPGSLPAPSALQELKKSGNTVSLDASGVVRTITAADGKTLGDNPDTFVSRYSAVFGLIKGHTMTRTTSADLPGGDQAQRYQQYVNGTPVLGSEIVVTTNAAGAVRGAVAGTSALAPSGTAKVSSAKAQETGISAAVKELGLNAGEVTAKATLWMYQALGASALAPTYWVKLSEADGHDVATVLVNAVDGAVILTASAHQSLDNRIVCDLSGTAVNLNIYSAYRCQRNSPLAQGPNARAEGQSASAVADVNKAYDHLGVAYDYFHDNFGRDSFDGHGAQVTATVRACHGSGSPWDCPFQNAFWEGSQFVFGAGWATDDVVAHEFTHAVTENASQLYYWGQSGAINEAFSDIFSQFIDLQSLADDQGARRWQMGEDLPSRPDGTSGAIRNMMDPHMFGQPAYLYESPYWISNYSSDQGGVHRNSGVANRIAAMLYDGSPGNSVAAIGAQRSAQLWYRAMHLMPSGGNYTQLGMTLMASCRELIGKYGFTPAHCTAVENALTATNVQHPQPGNLGLCSGQPATDLFFDDFENGRGKWTGTALVSYYPDDAPFTYAASGKGSLEGLGSGSYGNNGTIDSNSFTVPATGSSWVTFNSATLQGDSPGLAGVKLFVDNGSGQQQVPGTDWVAGTLREYTLNQPTPSYSLAQWAGQQIKLRFQVFSLSGFVDFFLDDVRAYQCDPAKPGAIQDGYAYADGSNLKIDWKSAYAAGSSNFNDYHFELSYSPAIPGAPTTFRPSSVQSRYVVTVPGIDPAQKYTVTVKVKMDLGGGAEGPPVTMVVDPQAPLSCANQPGAVRLPPVYRMPNPLPPNVCFPEPLPRR